MSVLSLRTVKAESAEHYFNHIRRDEIFMHVLGEISPNPERREVFSPSIPMRIETLISGLLHVLAHPQVMGHK